MQCIKQTPTTPLDYQGENIRRRTGKLIIYLGIFILIPLLQRFLVWNMQWTGSMMKKLDDIGFGLAQRVSRK